MKLVHYKITRVGDLKLLKTVLTQAPNQQGT